MSQSGQAAGFARDIVARLAPGDAHLLADRARLAEVRQARAEQAARYFASHAANWDEVRAMHLPEERVEAAILEAVGTGPFNAALDLGTGGRPHARNSGAACDARGRRRSVAANAQRRQGAY
ncbi:Demethylmenaquinone methyltransferase / 2-methoxy-6-polyprenyl-1,4-benzoquinol methylase/ArsR family transcriptional regulator (fragment) [Methylocella tundrae]|uniref:Demethylmenaquinone methyltransferase / 2-methoxy-6-polyprenyl-1,4-benzoquinol methylase/ArsR family transcriptional regulator n=1 Tax=Methylocella tundrae TaxID=227605 RepID=A0A4U8YXF4_METTU